MKIFLMVFTLLYMFSFTPGHTRGMVVGDWPLFTLSEKVMWISALYDGVLNGYQLGYKAGAPEVAWDQAQAQAFKSTVYQCVANIPMDVAIALIDEMVTNHPEDRDRLLSSRILVVMASKENCADNVD